MLWVKSFHIVAMVTWFAGLFYLPRLFVYHAMSEDTLSKTRFKTMEHKLFYTITTPGALLTIGLGLWMLQENWTLYKTMGWMHAKLGLVGLLIGYHLFCGYYLRQFKRDQNHRSALFYRWFNEVPVLILVAIVVLVVVKPF